VLSADISPERFQQRAALLDSIDKMRASAHASPALDKMDSFHHRAIGMLTSTTVREAFEPGEGA